MASINLYPTFTYSQPKEYHFSHDSVFLARRAFEYLRENKITVATALDLCAGCGVIGLDFLFHLRAEGMPVPRVFDFLEVQDQYETHFKTNVTTLGVIETRLQFIKGNYGQKLNSDLSTYYDLIVCNPPYFSKEQGKLPTSDLKLRSRFFIDSDLPSLIEFIYERLSPTGKAFVLIRNQLEHKQDQLAAVLGLCKEKLNIQLMDDVRGTNVVLLSKI